MLIPNQDRKPRKANLGSLLLIAFVLAIGGLSASYVYTQVDEAGRTHILERAATIAVAVPQDDLALVTGTEEDLAPYRTSRSRSIWYACAQ